MTQSKGPSVWSSGFDGKHWGREVEWRGVRERNLECVQEDWTGRFGEEKAQLWGENEARRV